MAFVTALPANTYPAGSRVFEAPIDDAVSEITARASRDGWTDTGSNIIEVKLFVSLDDGATFQFWAGFTSSGGIVTDRLGNVVTHSSINVRLPTRGNFPRKLRIEEINTVAITTTLDFEVR